MTLADPSGSFGASRPASQSMAAGVHATIRDPRLDFFRGVAMFIILIAHTPRNWLTLWIPARWGFSDATEIFVFCSGMASAIAFGKVFQNQGMAIGTARVGFRVWQVYWAHIALFFAIAATMASLNATELFDRDYVGQLNLYPFFRNPEVNLPALLTLRYVPNYFDILPMYLVILAMMPLVVFMVRIHKGLAAAVLIGLWFFAQKRILTELGLEGYHIALPAEPWSARNWFFNPFGWQLVFFTGFAFMAGWIPAPPINKWLVGLALFLVLGNVIFSNVGIRELGFDWARSWRVENRIWITKSDFGILRYVHFISLAYLAWAAVGDKGRRLLPPETGTFFANVWRVVLAMIMKVGQQSLAVFITSMFLARLLGVTFDVVGRTHLTMTLVNLGGFAILIGVAYGAGWFKSQPWRKKKAA